MLSEQKQRNVRRTRRALHTKRTVRGSALRPRLAVFRSNKHLLAQIIDDENRVTLVGIGTMSKTLKNTKHNRKSKEAAQQLGKILADEAKKKQIETVVFDRSHYKYHGVIAALADAAREAGLKF
jgi:large subunit ribosomal protein L18